VDHRAAPDDAPAVVIDGLTKSFSDEVLAVDDVHFTVGRGQVFGLLGPNGAGKTTALRMLLGLIRPSAGSASILGERVRPSAPVLARVGALVESPAFVPHLSGLANLHLYWAAGPNPHDDMHLDAALKVAGLGDAVRRKVRTYSQGMRQRLGLAQALLGRPVLVILDEPTNGMDPQQMREVRRLMTRLADDGTTVLLSSHLLAEVEQVCTHAAVMNRGRLVTTGTVAALTGPSNSVLLEVDDRGLARSILGVTTGVVDVGEQDDGLVVRLQGIRSSDVVARLVHGGVAVEQAMARRHLEDAFIELLAEDKP
jgi:ABC-2 type transport system ATP-binding protein